MSKHSAAVAKSIDYMLRRWDGFARFIEDGRICLTNNAAERAAAMVTLINTAKLSDIDPQAWLADVLDRIADIPKRQHLKPIEDRGKRAPPGQPAGIA